MLGIILLNWNGGDDTLDALRSLRSADLPPSTTILVADNGSTDGSLDQVRAHFPDVRIRENGTNLGFAGGCNRAWKTLADAGADTILFLNNDAVVAPDTIGKMMTVLAAHPEFGAVSPRIYAGCGPTGGKEIIWYEKGQTHPEAFSVAVHVPATDAERTAPWYETEIVCGCALLLRTETLRRLDGFDEPLFAYYEDVDLSLRIRRSLGLKLAVVPDAHVWHKVSRSTGGELSPTAAFYLARNARRVAWRNGTAAEWHTFRRQFFVAWLAQVRYFTRGGAPPFNALSGGAALMGGLCALLGQSGPRPHWPAALFVVLARLLARIP